MLPDCEIFQLKDCYKMGLFRKRDIAVLILIAVSIYISYMESPGLSYQIDPAWFIDQTSDSTLSNKVVDYKMVKPIITDLEGDGINEVVMVSSDFKLKVSMRTFVRVSIPM